MKNTNSTDYRPKTAGCKEMYEARFANGRILWRGTRAECDEAANGTSAKIYKANSDSTQYMSSYEEEATQ